MPGLPPRLPLLEPAAIVLASVPVGLAVATNNPLWAAVVISLVVLAAILHRPHLGLWLMFLLLPVALGIDDSPIIRFVNYGLPVLVLALLSIERRGLGEPVWALPSSLTLWLLAFVAWTVLVSLFSPAVFLGIVQAFRYGLILLALACFWNLWNLPTLRRAFLLMAVLLSIVAVYGIWQFVSHGAEEVIYSRVAEAHRLSSFYGNANDLGAWMGHGLMVLVPLLLLRSSRPWTLARGATNLLLFLVAAVLFGGLLVSFSRASYLYVLAGLVPVALCHRRLRWAAVAGLAAIPVVLVFLPIPRWMAAGLRLESGASFRTSLWSAGWQMMLDHPWTGVGTAGTFSLIRGQYLEPDVYRGLLQVQAGGAHNVFISRGAEMGILGLVLALALFLMLWIRIPQALRDYRRGDWLAGAAAAGVIGLTVRGMFERSYTLGLGTIVDSLVFFLFALILIGRRTWGQSGKVTPGSPAGPSS